MLGIRLSLESDEILLVKTSLAYIHAVQPDIRPIYMLAQEKIIDPDSL